jgi:hypothetical protein
MSSGNWRLEFVTVAGLILLIMALVTGGQLAGFWAKVWG